MSVFKALRDFKSNEFGDTQYVKGMTYSIRAKSEATLKAQSRPTLQEMCVKWLDAKIFKMKAAKKLFGVTFTEGSESYHIDDEFGSVVEGWVEAGEAEYVEGGLITFNVESASGSVRGEG